MMLLMRTVEKNICFYTIPSNINLINREAFLLHQQATKLGDLDGSVGRIRSNMHVLVCDAYMQWIEGTDKLTKMALEQTKIRQLTN